MCNYSSACVPMSSPEEDQGSGSCHGSQPGYQPLLLRRRRGTGRVRQATNEEPIPPSSNPFANTAWSAAMASPAAPADEASESAPTANASTGVSRQASNAQDSAPSRSRVPTTTSSLQIETSRLPSMPFRLFALDLESTHSFAGARMLEIAVVDVASGAAWHSLVGPGTWDDYDRQMLGAGYCTDLMHTISCISPSDLLTAPDFPAVWSQLTTWVTQQCKHHGETPLIIAHNGGSLDFPLIVTEAMRHGLMCNLHGGGEEVQYASGWYWLDTLKFARSLSMKQKHQLPNLKLSGLREAFGARPPSHLHRALPDAQVLAEVFMRMLLLECAGVSCQQLVTDPRFSHATLGSHNVFPPEMTSFASGSTAGSGSSSHSFQLEPVSRSAQGSVDGSNPAVRQDEGLQLLLQFMQQPAAGHGQQQPAGAVCSSSAGLQGLLQGVLAAAPNAWGPLADIQPLRSKTNGNIVSRLYYRNWVNFATGQPVNPPPYHNTTSPPRAAGSSNGGASSSSTNSHSSNSSSRTNSSSNSARSYVGGGTDRNADRPGGAGASHGTGSSGDSSKASDGSGSGSAAGSITNDAGARGWSGLVNRSRTRRTLNAIHTASNTSRAAIRCYSSSAHHQHVLAEEYAPACDTDRSRRCFCGMGSRSSSSSGCAPLSRMDTDTKVRGVCASIAPTAAAGRIGVSDCRAEAAVGRTGLNMPVMSCWHTTFRKPGTCQWPYDTGYAALLVRPEAHTRQAPMLITHSPEPYTQYKCRTAPLRAAGRAIAFGACMAAMMRGASGLHARLV